MKPYTEILRRLRLIFALSVAVVPLQAQNNAWNPLSQLVSETPQSKAFPLVTTTQTATICYDTNEHKGVIRAITDLQSDIEKVTARKPALSTKKPSTSLPLIIGTMGKSATIDRLIKNGRIKSTDLKGKWESYVITTVERPFEGTEKALVIAGSDKRGTIYGIYELSKQLGVSPWYWWADVPTQKRAEAYINPVYFASGEPKVKYRGIFINDENPCMQTWARAKFGGMNSEMYAHVFELLLRLKANYLWPGMWGSFTEWNPLIHTLYNEQGEYEGNSFNEDDPRNPALADEYGIVMGTSHHEPMQRSQQEWLRNKQRYGNSEWNYMTNKQGIQQFFREGMEHTKNYESVITLGMRGDDDKPMVDAGSAEANFKVLESIISDQRQIIKEVTKQSANRTPQVWTLYKEVLEYFDLGLKIPDDVIVLLCDDDWGDIRRLPELDSKRHRGGYGIYYHVAYYGAPRASKWLNNSQIEHMWEQLQLTYDYGVDKIWILNVGDIKPNEYPIDFFLTMAWNPKAFTADNLQDYAVDFCRQQFGDAHAKEAARILSIYCKYAARVVPEMLDDSTFNLASGEYKRVRDEFLALEAQALRQFIALSDNYQDAYKELVLFPVQALANLYDLYYSLAMNRQLAQERDLRANAWADRAEACFKHDSLLTADYNHNIADGKWKHITDQVHIGYTSWHPPHFNTMPVVSRVLADEALQGNYVFSRKNGVVAIEAEHYYSKNDAQNARWTVVPNLGRSLSGICLMPYTQSVEGASLRYKMTLDASATEATVHLVFDCTLPYKKGGHRVSVGFIGGKEVTININDDLTWANNYTIMYPTAAARIIEKELRLTLPASPDGMRELELRPLDAGIVFQKIVVDCGGYEKERLFMNESPYHRVSE